MEYRIDINFTDLRAGIRHDATVARKERFFGVADRADHVLAQLEEGEEEMRIHGGRWVTEIVLRHVMED